MFIPAVTTKDETHQRRAGSEIKIDIDFTPDMLLRMKKKAFLANPRNKQNFFFDLLSSLLKDNGIDVKQSPGDADYDIFMSACRAALETNVVVVADDTDILVLLQHHFNPASDKKIYLQTSTKLLDISVLQNAFQTALSRSLLFIHALSGCDTTSRPFGVGKLSDVAKYEKPEGCASVFLSEQQSHADIEQAGHQTLATVYGCSDLNSGRV